MIDLLEHGGLYPSFDVAVDAKAVFDAVAATDACDPPGMQPQAAPDFGSRPVISRDYSADALGRHAGHASGWSYQGWD